MSRTTQATVKLRTAQVVKWLQQGLSRAQIVHMAAGEWNLRQRTVDTYLARAREVIDEATAQQTRDHLAHHTGLGRAPEPVPVDAHAETQPLPDVGERPDTDALVFEVGAWIRRQYVKADVAGDTRAGLQAAAQMAKLHGLNFDDRVKAEVAQDLERSEVNPVDALRELLQGARESREARGLAPRPTPPLATAEDVEQAVTMAFEG